MYSIFIFTGRQSFLRVLPSPCSGLPPQSCCLWRVLVGGTVHAIGNVAAAPRPGSLITGQLVAVSIVPCTTSFLAP